MIDRQRQAFKGRVYFKDFYGNDQNLTISVKLDITEFDRLGFVDKGYPEFD